MNAQLSDDERLDLARAQARRFWSKVERVGACWLWRAAVDKDGYGKFQLTLRSRRPSGQVAQQHLRAHRLAWELWFGPAPADLLALHACDTPACVNPLHITFGTQKRNREECRDRGRTARGERNGNRRFTEADVTRMRALSAAGQALPEIGEAFGCDPRTVYSIVQRRTWGHVA